MYSLRPVSLSLGFRNPNRKGTGCCFCSPANEHLEPGGQNKRIYKEIELPGGGFWWLGARNDETVLYGDTWTIRRPRIGGEGLVPASKAPKAIQQSIHTYSHKIPGSNYPVVRPNLPTGLVASGIVVLDTEFEVLSDSGAPEREPAVPGNISCTGIVHVGSTADGNQDDVSNRRNNVARHPRRTARIQFTCNLCGMRNEKFVNPHAWRRGSVFAKCEDCKVVHKLRDNLKV